VYDVTTPSAAHVTFANKPISTPVAAIGPPSSVGSCSAKNSKGSPTMPVTLVPNVSKYPHSIQTGPTTANAPKPVIIMFSADFERVMPP
jgi:hypothetical protein